MLRIQLSAEQALRDEAGRLLAVGDVPLALRKLQEALRYAPGDPQTLEMVVTALLQAEQPEEALRVATDARAVDPRNPALTLLHGRALQELAIENGLETLCNNRWSAQDAADKAKLVEFLQQAAPSTADPAHLPNFLCIGAHKAGTHWVWANLRQHPGAYLYRSKEIHFFDKDYWRRLAVYAQYFRHHATRCKGEATPKYALLPDERIAFIAQHMPRLKLVFMMRNPMERAWSSLKMDLFRNQKLDPATTTQQQMLAYLDADHVTRRSDYHACILRWRRHYPQQQFFLGFMEDMKRQPEELFGRLLRFLELPQPASYEGYPLRQKHYEGAQLPMPPAIRQHLKEKYRPMIVRLAETAGDRVLRWLED